MTVKQATTFTYPIAFSSNNVLAFKQAKSNSNGNNYLMREAGIGIPNNISVSLPGTSPALSFYVFVPKTTSTSATATGAEYLGTTSVNLYLHGTSGWYFVGGH